MNWYARVFGSELGPMPFDDLKVMVEHGELGVDDEVRSADRNDWMRAGDVAGLLSAVKQPASSPTESVGPESGQTTSQWYCEILGSEFGPMPFDDLRTMAQSGELSADDRVKSGRDGAWQPARRITGLVPLPDTPASTASAGTAESTEAVPTRETSEADEAKWYCQSLGAELGPMSFDDLVTMVRHGGLAGEDPVRQGPTGEWTAAETVPELYAELILAGPVGTSPSAPPAGSDAPDTTDSKPAALVKQSVPTNAAPAKTESAAKTESVASRETEPETTTATPADSDAAAQTDVPDEPVAPAAQSSPPVEETPAAAPVQQPPKTASPIVSATTAPASTPVVAPAKPPGAVAPVWRPTSGGGRSIDLGSWVSGAARYWKVAATVAVVAAMVGLLSLLPRGGNPREFYDTYSAIWEEHKQLRSSGASAAKWSALEVKATGQLEPIVDVLNSAADADDRLRQHLLFAGRDYLPVMLKDARAEPSKMEALFEQHMQAAGRILAGEPSP